MGGTSKASTGVADCDGYGVYGVRLQSSRVWVAGKGDADIPQVIDQVGGLSGRRDLGAALLAAAPGMTIIRVQDGQGGQPGEDLASWTYRFFGLPAARPPPGG